jgi:tripartite-type tricarboxylate transporter receptor subunit TctC
MATVVKCVAMMCFCGASGWLGAQEYPVKPIRIVTAAPGGAGDLVARIIGQKLTSVWGQQVLVDPRGGGVVGPAETVAKAPPDGYTLLLYGSSVWLLPFMRENVSWDPVKDFSPITLATSSPNILIVHPSVPTKSVKELIALAKARPGAFNYATGPSGTVSHLAAELFKAMSRTDMVRIGYKGTAEAHNDLITGRVQIMFDTMTAATPLIKSGKAKALAVTSAQSSVLAPGVPTVAATGLDGYEAVSTLGVFGQSKMAPGLVTRLNTEIVRLLNKPDVKERVLNGGMEVTASSADQLMAKMKSEMARMGKVIKDAGIRED